MSLQASLINAFIYCVVIIIPTAAERNDSENCENTAETLLIFDVMGYRVINRIKELELRDNFDSSPSCQRFVIFSLYEYEHH